MLWKKHINSVLMNQDLNFKHTTYYDHIILKTTFKDHNVLVLLQVDNMTIQTDDEDIAKGILRPLE